jgi:hypothetical protein
MGLGSEQFIVNSKGQKTAVIMPMNNFKRLMKGSEGLSMPLAVKAETIMARRSLGKLK